MGAGGRCGDAARKRSEHMGEMVRMMTVSLVPTSFPHAMHSWPIVCTGAMWNFCSTTFMKADGSAAHAHATTVFDSAAWAGQRPAISTL